jgi:large subunit ribosomal protein L17
MRHRKKTVKLGRAPAHRDALLSGLVCHLIESGRIRTTLPKAKAARGMADRMVSLGKRGTLAARRRAVARLRRPSAVRKLFAEVAPAFAERKGGYTRILKLGARPSDNAEMALLEWTERPVTPAASAPASE